MRMMPLRESYEEYPYVISGGGKYRVIRCKDDIQWIVQRAEKSSRGKAWRGVRYFRTKKALVAFYGTLQERYDLSELDTLPEYYGR